MSKLISSSFITLLMMFAPLTMAENEIKGYPNKPIRLVVPFAPGGGTDTIARLIGAKLSVALDQSIVVENRAGAGGILGARVVAQSAPDGYTLRMVTAGHIINGLVQEQINYDPVHSFAPVALIGEAPYILVVGPAVAAKTLDEFVAIAKNSTGTLSYASSGTASGPHLAGELFKNMANIEMLHVPFKGGGPADVAVLSGQVSSEFASGSALPYIKEGRLQAIGVTGAKRIEALPNVPAIAETLPGYNITSWFGLLAPAGTPASIISTLNRSIAAILRSGEIGQRLQQAGVQPTPSDAAHFGAFLHTEKSKYEELVTIAGITNKVELSSLQQTTETAP